MAEPPSDLVRIDETGTAHAVSRTASQMMRARKGTFRLMPAPGHIVFMRYVGDDGKRDEEDGAIVKLSGEITKRGVLCDILALVGHAGWKGELMALDGATSRSIFFENGNVIAAQSNAEGERLGEMLYQFGALSREQIEECAKVPGKRIGDAAVDLGLISREKLFAVMAKQAEEIVYKTMQVGDGMFYFLDRFDESRIAVRHNLGANALLMEGVRRMDEMSYFRERVPSDEHVPVRVPNKGEPSKEVADVFAAVDGQRTVADLGRALEMSMFDVTRAIFQLAQTGHVQVRPPKPTDPLAAVETFNSAIRMIYKQTEEAGGLAELTQTLGSFASSSGVYDALFMFAGPAEDGSVRGERVVTNIASLAGDDTLASLCQWLYDYASFALFAAGSILPKDKERALTRQVADIVAALQPHPPSDGSNRASIVNIYIE